MVLKFTSGVPVKRPEKSRDDLKTLQSRGTLKGGSLEEEVRKSGLARVGVEGRSPRAERVRTVTAPLSRGGDAKVPAVQYEQGTESLGRKQTTDWGAGCTFIYSATGPTLSLGSDEPPESKDQGQGAGRGGKAPGRARGIKARSKNIFFEKICD